MRRFAAQYIITGDGEVIKHGTVTVDDDHTILEVIAGEEGFKERASTTFHNGIIVPGFVNSHCHLELSAMKGLVERGTGLPGFVREIREKRFMPGNGEEQIKIADSYLWENGTQACVDICNTASTFRIKANSPVKYINLLEVFGIDPSAADRRIEEVLALQAEAEGYGLNNNITPHSLYSPSKPLLLKMLALTSSNSVTSVHFMESEAEKEFLEKGEGDMLDSYLAMGISADDVHLRANDHISGILNLVTGSGNLLLVHNTYITESDIKALEARAGIFYCLCPGSNLYIENRIPPVSLLMENDVDMVIGTDSLASNDSLSMLDEMYRLQEAFPGLSLRDIIPWATSNGASAIGMGDQLGAIRPGMRPGLILIEDVDFAKLRLLQNSYVVRLD